MDTARLENDFSGTREEELGDSLQKIWHLSDHELGGTFNMHIPADHPHSAEFWDLYYAKQFVIINIFGKTK